MEVVGVPIQCPGLDRDRCLDVCQRTFYNTAADWKLQSKHTPPGSRTPHTVEPPAGTTLGRIQGIGGQSLKLS